MSNWQKMDTAPKDRVIQAIKKINGKWEYFDASWSKNDKVWETPFHNYKTEELDYWIDRPAPPEEHNPRMERLPAFLIIKMIEIMCRDIEGLNDELENLANKFLKGEIEE